jgi:hypothetical protein
MCSPGAAIAIQAGGAVSSAYGSYTQGLAQKNYYDYLAGQSERTAGLVRRQGEQAVTMAQDYGLSQTKELKRDVAQVEGAQAVGAGANVGPGSVTTADIAKDTFNKAKLDELAIKYNADMESWKATNDAAMKAYELEQEAAGYRLVGKAAKKAGKWGAFNDLLSGAGQVANTWLMSKQFAPSKQATATIGGQKRTFQIR